MKRSSEIDKLLSEPITWDNRESVLQYMPYNSQVRFALFCAKKVAHLTEAKEAHDAIKVTELWLEGKATIYDCETATRAAHNAAYAINNSYGPVIAAASDAVYVAYLAIDADNFTAHSIKTANAASAARACFCAADYAFIATEKGKQEQIKAEIVLYLRELVIEELPQDLKEDWLLITSL